MKWIKVISILAFIALSIAINVEAAEPEQIHLATNGIPEIGRAHV